MHVRIWQPGQLHTCRYVHEWHAFLLQDDAVLGPVPQCGLLVCLHLHKKGYTLLRKPQPQLCNAPYVACQAAVVITTNDCLPSCPCLQELQRALTTLAFPPTSPKCPPQYLRLYEPSRWEDLVNLFRKVGRPRHAGRSQTDCCRFCTVWLPRLHPSSVWQVIQAATLGDGRKAYALCFLHWLVTSPLLLAIIITVQPDVDATPTGAVSAAWPAS
jgi:hypothetical protein